MFFWFCNFGAEVGLEKFALVAGVGVAKQVHEPPVVFVRDGAHDAAPGELARSGS